MEERGEHGRGEQQGGRGSSGHAPKLTPKDGAKETEPGSLAPPRTAVAARPPLPPALAPEILQSLQDFWRWAPGLRDGPWNGAFLQKAPLPVSAQPDATGRGHGGRNTCGAPAVRNEGASGRSGQRVPRDAGLATEHRADGAPGGRRRRRGLARDGARGVRRGRGARRHHTRGRVPWDWCVDEDPSPTLTIASARRRPRNWCVDDDPSVPVPAAAAAENPAITARFPAEFPREFCSAAGFPFPSDPDL